MLYDYKNENTTRIYRLSIYIKKHFNNKLGLLMLNCFC